MTAASNPAAELTEAEVNRVARLLMAAWEEAEGREVTVSYVATFADMARAVIADRLAAGGAAADEGLRALVIARHTPEADGTCGWCPPRVQHPCDHLRAALDAAPAPGEERPGQPVGKSEGLDDAGPIPCASSPRRQDPPAPSRVDDTARCNCGTFGSASLCPFHTQADFDSAKAHRADDTAAVVERVLSQAADELPGGMSSNGARQWLRDRAAALAGAPSAPACDTCNDAGRVPWMSEGDPYGYQERADDGTIPCPDCAAPSAPAKDQP